MILESKVWKFGDNISTDLMMPGPQIYSQPGISDEEAAMCLRSEYDLYARKSSKPVNSKPARSLVDVLRDLFRPRRPQVEQAEVVPLRAGVATRSDKEAVREPSKAA